MNINGRCRRNGAQLGQYLESLKDNVRAEFLAMHGATSSNPRRHVLEMSLSSELSRRSDDGLYHMQLSPRAEEAAAMTWDQKKRSVEITIEKMELNGHRWALYEHEKADGRIHMHLVFERYNHDTGRMWNDLGNYDKHMAASRQMEKEFGWQITHENKNHLSKEVKEIITDFYLESETPTQFVETMAKAGFEVTQGMDRRPYQIVDQYGKVHNLTKQLEGIGQADVSKYLNSIRQDLRPTAEASHDRRAEYQRSQPEQQHSENLHEISDSQDLAEAMINHVKQHDKETEQDKQSETVQSYGLKFDQLLGQPPSLPHQPKEKNHSENLRQISDSQDVAAAMKAEIEQRRIERNRIIERNRVKRENKVQEAQKQAVEQTKPANDNQPPKYYNPITGQEMTAEAWQKMQEILDRAKQREQERNARNRGGLEY